MTLIPTIPPLFPYTTLFRSYHLTIGPTDLAALEHDFRSPEMPKTYHPLIEFRYEDVSIADAQIRLKGSSSWRQTRSEEHTSELQSPCNLVCRLLLEKQKQCS